MPAWKAGVLPLHQSDIDRLCPFDQEAVSARRYAPGDRMLSPWVKKMARGGLELPVGLEPTT